MKRASHKKLTLWKTIIYNIKKYNGCYYCKESDPCCIDFHHKDPSKKLFHISSGRRNGRTLTDLINEIKKCVCLCSNCHRKLHGGVLPKPIRARLRLPPDLPEVEKLDQKRVD